jgi:type III secretion system YscQ/HrcQ family protein
MTTTKAESRSVPSPVSLFELSQGAAALDRRLSRSFEALTVRVNRLQIGVTPCSIIEARRAIKTPVPFRARVDGLVGFLICDRDDVRDLIGAQHPFLRTDVLPVLDLVETLTSASLLSGPLASEEASDANCLLEFDAEAGAGEPCFAARWTCGPVSGAAVVLDRGSAAARLGELLETWPLRDNGLPDPLRVFGRLGSTMVPIRDLRSAAPGDVLLLDRQAEGAVQPTISIGSRLWTTAPWGAGFSVRLDRFTSTDPSPEHDTMARAGSDSPSSPVDTLLEDAPVRVIFEFGHVDVSLAELKSLAPGYIFHVPDRERLEVDLMLGGRRIGRGELVEIDGMPGVRIVRINRV